MVAATGSGTAASRGTKKDGSDSGGNKGPQGRASSGPSSSGGGARGSGAGGAGGVRGGNSTGSAQHESAGSQARSGGSSPASSARSGPGGAGGVRRDTSGGMRQAQTSAMVGGSAPRGSILGNPSVVSRAGSGLLSGTQKQATQYGLGTRLTTPAQNYVDVFSNQYNKPGYSMNIDPRLAENLFHAVQDYSKQYGTPTKNLFETGLRSYEVQKGIYGRSFLDANGIRHKEQQWAAARPGRSNHQFGLAADLKAGPFRDFVRSNLNNYGLETVPNDLPHVQLAGSVGLRRGMPMATNANMGLGYADTPAPTLADAVRAPKMQDRISPDMDMSGYRSPMASVGSLPSLSDAVRNMNMAGYQSPMAQVGNIPAEPGRMNMGGYQSPMAGVGNLPSEPGSMNMAGYNSPMAGVSGVPGQQKIQDRLSAGYSGPAHFNPPGAPMTKGPVLTSDFNGIKDQSRISDPLSAGMSFNPGLPGQMAPNMDMAGYQSPMVGTSGMPRAPSGNIAGMSFNPGLPGMMSGPSRSRSPMVNGEPQMASNFPARPEYLGSYPAAPTQTAQGIPNQPGLEAQNKSGGLLAGLGKAIKTAAAAPVQKVEDLANTVKNNIKNPLLGLMRPPGPGNPLYEAGKQHAYRGGDVPAQWTGKESPTVVAQMQQHVEDVLRSYFTGELVNPVA